MKGVITLIAFKLLCWASHAVNKGLTSNLMCRAICEATSVLEMSTQKLQPEMKVECWLATQKHTNGN